VRFVSIRARNSPPFLRHPPRSTSVVVKNVTDER